MKIETAFGDIHLTYCLNIHPGERWADNLSAIRQHARAVRDRLNPDAPFAIGLRLSAQAAAELAAPEVLQPFTEFLHQNRLYVFTVNGFPYGTFHGATVKEHAYRPDWTDRRRVDYTLRLGHILAAILPENVPGSISTVPGTYRQWSTAANPAGIIGNLLDVVAEFAKLEKRTGRRIGLALEPEPDCLWDQARQLIELFEDHLRPAARSGAAARAAIRLHTDPRVLLRRHLGVCLDTCHQSVIFEDPDSALAQVLDHDIRVHKLQVSAAPAFPCTDAGLREAAAFIDPVYLHQSCIRDATGTLTRHPDLPAALEDARHREPEAELRTHFHIPLVLEDSHSRRSTRTELTPSFWKRVVRTPITQVEVETYSFNVLPAHLRDTSVVDNIAAELRWTVAALNQARET